MFDQHLRIWVRKGDYNNCTQNEECSCESPVGPISEVLTDFLNYPRFCRNPVGPISEVLMDIRSSHHSAFFSASSIGTFPIFRYSNAATTA